MAPPLTGARLKIRRANAQFETLKAEMTDFLKASDKPYRLSVEFKRETREHCVVIKIIKQPPTI